MSRKEKVIEVLKVLGYGLLVYYFIPFFAYGFNQSGANIYAKICVLLVNNIYALIAGIIITKKCGFKLYYSFLVAFIYVPSALFYYNNDTVIYSVLYIIMYIVGTLIQLNIRKK